MIELYRYARTWSRQIDDSWWVPFVVTAFAVITGSVTEAKHALLITLVNGPDDDDDED